MEQNIELWKKGLPTLDGFTCEGVFLVCFTDDGIRYHGEVAIKADETIWHCGMQIDKKNVLAWLDYPAYEGN